jgi:hypothetical protein
MIRKKFFYQLFLQPNPMRYEFFLSISEESALPPTIVQF